MARRVHFWSLIFVVAAVPLPLGANRPLAWTPLAFAIGLLCLTWPFAVSRDRIGQALTPRTLIVPLTGFTIAIAWAILQTVPGFWPGAADSLWAKVARAIAQAGGPPVQPSISIDREATWTGIMRLLTYGGVFWLFLQHGHLSRRAYQAVDALALIAIAYAVYGLAEFASGTETILGMAKWAYIGDLTGTFVNRNSYATFAGLGLLCCVSATARRLASWRSGWLGLLHLRRRTAIFAVGGLAVGLSLVFSGSRAGTAAGLVGLISLVLLTLVAHDRISRRRGAQLAAGLGIAVVGASSWLLLASQIFTVGAFDRAIVYRLTLQAIAERPVTGTGLGTFPAVFESLRPTTLVLPWHEAHDTYLELALELGIPATLCLLAPIAWSGFRGGRALLRGGSQSEQVALAVAAILLVGVHSLIDFSAQIPAVTVYWLAILGTGVAQAGLQERRFAQRHPGTGRVVSQRQAERG